jgi:hypothetical protein
MFISKQWLTEFLLVTPLFRAVQYSDTTASVMNVWLLQCSLYRTITSATVHECTGCSNKAPHCHTVMILVVSYVDTAPILEASLAFPKLLTREYFASPHVKISRIL